MCGRGEACDLCSRRAEFALFWESWAGNYCGPHATELRAKQEPERVDKIEWPVIE